jgi:PAS domain S-box-containing protein
MLSFVGVFPFPEVFYVFADYGTLLLLTSFLVGSRITKRFIRHVILMANNGEIAKKYQKHLKRLPIYYFGILFLYFAIGLLTTLYSLSTLHAHDYPASKYLISFLGVIPGGLITALPIFFYLTDSLGRYLAPHGIHISVAPILLKLIVLGLFVPVLIDTLLIMYFYDRTGYFGIETLGIWLFLVMIAAVGTRMAWQSFKQGLSPFVTALETQSQSHANVSIIPKSLDELGLLSQRWNELWNKVLDYEKCLSDSNSLLKSNVQQRSKELETERYFINKVLDNAGALVIVLNRKGHIIRFNPACEQVTGFTFDELRDRPIWDWLVPPEQLEKVKQVFENLADEGLDSQYENELMKSDGGRVLVAWNNSTIRGQNGKVQYIVSIGIDISERHKAQQALQQAKEIAEKASRAKSEFLSHMSHELRTPMNAILGFAQLLKMDEQLDKDQQDSVNEILQAGSHLMELINEVLDLSRIEAGKLEIKIDDINVSKIINESLTLFDNQAKMSNIELINNIPQDCHFIALADQLRFKQVFINLLSNAIKYNKDNGKVIIDLSLPEQDKIRISISDTGPGIPAYMHDRLFKPFERLPNQDKHTVEGTGIGLALSKQLLELMNGEIGLESEANRGSTFYIELPLVCTQPQDSSPSS